MKREEWEKEEWKFSPPLFPPLLLNPHPPFPSPFLGGPVSPLPLPFSHVLCPLHISILLWACMKFEADMASPWPTTEIWGLLAFGPS